MAIPQCNILVNCGIWERCIVGFVRWVDWLPSLGRLVYLLSCRFRLSSCICNGSHLWQRSGVTTLPYAIKYSLQHSLLKHHKGSMQYRRKLTWPCQSKLFLPWNESHVILCNNTESFDMNMMMNKSRKCKKAFSTSDIDTAIKRLSYSDSQFQ